MAQRQVLRKGSPHGSGRQIADGSIDSLFLNTTEPVDSLAYRSQKLMLRPRPTAESITPRRRSRPRSSLSTSLRATTLRSCS